MPAARRQILHGPVATSASRLRTLAALVVVTACASLTACSSARSLLPDFTESPRSRYASRLASAGLETSALAQDWLAAGDRALSTPHNLVLPFRETAYVDAARPAAIAYRMTLGRGRVLVVDVSFESTAMGRLFVDLFREPVGQLPNPSPIASLDDDATTLRFEITDDGTYLLRVQAELLRGGRYTLVNRTEASLRTFPVEGLTPRAVQSGFGDPRDAGGREHQGIDIFARRNTPVVAVVAGTASASTNNLGGNVVWLRERGARRTFYYAHLERVAIETSRSVSAGDVIGYVGNTGNARTTAPHLHFGVYSPRPIDPAPFLASDDDVPPVTALPAQFAGEWGRATRDAVPLMAGPHATMARVALLDRDTVFRVEASSSYGYRIVLPDARSGYVRTGDVGTTSGRLRRSRLANGAQVRDEPGSSAPVIVSLGRGSQVDVIGTFGAFTLVRLDDGSTGWVDRADMNTTAIGD